MSTAFSAAATLTYSSASPPGAVGATLQVQKINGGADLRFTWTDIANADDYAVYEDSDPAGAFASQAGVAADGATGLTVPLPGGTLKCYLVAGRNLCGPGPK